MKKVEIKMKINKEEGTMKIKQMKEQISNAVWVEWIMKENEIMNEYVKEKEDQIKKIKKEMVDEQSQIIMLVIKDWVYPGIYTIAFADNLFGDVFRATQEEGDYKAVGDEDDEDEDDEDEDDEDEDDEEDIDNVEGVIEFEDEEEEEDYEINEGDQLNEFQEDDDYGYCDAVKDFYYYLLYGCGFYYFYYEDAIGLDNAQNPVVGIFDELKIIDFYQDQDQED
ncbi:MAG: hypothetical protein EZS28_003176 [Streblomastix strix]|uniref:Uncharacterized protein n=1 Tax=Streblomastix strix TaxID=222440 RepID=A0A5J4X204_9EUKA|nr:MAG: hypothetical protein EZS28_003176 [Streblomastix strix]